MSWHRRMFAWLCMRLYGAALTDQHALSTMRVRLEIQEKITNLYGIENAKLRLAVARLEHKLAKVKARGVRRGN